MLGRTDGIWKCVAKREREHFICNPVESGYYIRYINHHPLVLRMIDGQSVLLHDTQQVCGLTTTDFILLENFYLIHQDYFVIRILF